MSKKILIIDDEDDIRIFIGNLLKDAGYEIEAAESGEEGLKKLEAGKFDLVLLDYFMPKMNGRQTLENMVNTNLLKGAKVVLYSVANLEAKEKKELKYLGVKDFIPKPTENEEFLARVKKALA